MGLLGGLKKIGKAVGGVAKQAAPFVGLIPGAGTIAGGALGGLGSLASGDSLGEALKYGAKGAVGGYLGSAALGGKGIAGLGGLLKGGSGASGILGGLKKVGGSPGKVIGMGPSGMPIFAPQEQGGGGGFLGSLGGLLGGGLKKIGGVDGLLGGASLGYGAYQQKQAGDMRNKALKMVEQDYASRAPLRSMGLQGMLNEQRPDLTSTFAGASDNPFSRRRVG